jgi:hypothetical protein
VWECSSVLVVGWEKGNGRSFLEFKYNFFENHSTYGTAEKLIQNLSLDADGRLILL